VTVEQCLICGRGLERHAIAGLLKCPGCGFVTADVQLTESELTALYGEGYFHGDEYADYVRDRPAAEKSFARRLQTLLRFVEEPATRRLFEVGAAYGYFLGMAKPLFRNVSGSDISLAAVRSARSECGVEVFCGDLLSLEWNEKIDVACMWDTIEHLARPDRYIEWLSDRMAPGSLLAITTGDIDSYVARWRGPKWRQIHPPTHLHYFSRRSLSRILEKYGYRVRFVGYDGMYRSLEMMSYIILCKRRNRPGIHDRLKRLGLLGGNVYLNLRDILFVVAEKTG
jgi:SAM-dependent methyltransferase